MTETNPTDGTERKEWVLILSMWPDDDDGFERPVLERVSDREKAEDLRHEYASNDGLSPSDYSVRRRENVESLPYEVSFDDCGVRYLNSSAENSEQSQDIYVGGLVPEDTYCIIVGETSLCGRLYRRLGHSNGAVEATHWDSEVQGQHDAEKVVALDESLCQDCMQEGGWNAVNLSSERANGSDS